VGWEKLLSISLNILLLVPNFLLEKKRKKVSGLVPQHKQTFDTSLSDLLSLTARGAFLKSFAVSGRLYELQNASTSSRSSLWQVSSVI